MIKDRLSQFNPLRNLDLPEFVSMLERGEQGYYADLQWLYRYVLKRNAVGRAVRRKLTSALAKLDWNIKIPAKLEGDRLKLAERQAETLRTAYDAIHNLRQARAHLAMADILGYAHCEKIYAGPLARKLKQIRPDRAKALEALNPWTVVELRPVPQWFFCREGLRGRWRYNPRAESTNTGGQYIDESHWMVREVEDPAAEIMTFAHLKMYTTDDDWDQFNDTYAVPPIFVEQPSGVRKEDAAEYQRMAEAVVSDGRGAHPHGGRVYNLTSGSDGVTCFTDRLRYFREEIVIAGTGGILTTLDGSTGIGKGPTEAHDDAWMDIAAEIGGWVSEIFNAQFDQSLLDREFPGAEHLAYFELDKPEHARSPKDIFEEAALAKSAGYEIDPAELEEKSGYKFQERIKPGSIKTEQIKQPPAPLLDPGEEDADASILQAALEENYDLEARWLAPVADVLAEIETLIKTESAPLESIVEKIEEAVGKMPELLTDLDVNALAIALENASGPAAVEGLAAGLRNRIKRRP